MPLDAKVQDDSAVDLEWLQLVLEARQLGLGIDEVRAFLQAKQTELRKISSKRSNVRDTRLARD